MYLGIDLGTSGIKMVLIEPDQSVRGSATRALSVSRPHPGWSEQNPADWIGAAEAALDALKAACPVELAAVRGIGLSGQMHGATILDDADRVLRPCILWNDTRSHLEAAALDADPKFREISGNIVFPGFTAPKLVWVKNNEPDIFARLRRVLLPKDYLRLWLTGEYMSEMSDSAGTSWLDVGARRWSSALLAATDVEERQMPHLVEGTDPAGTLRPCLARRWGLEDGVVVAGGAGDNAASACGMGIVGAGAAFVSLGTSGVLFAPTDSYRPNAASAVHTFCHAIPGTWHQMGVTLSCADSLDWLADIVGRDGASLAGALGTTLRAPKGVTFLPYLSGERTPHNDALIRGAFAGLDRGTGPEELAQAIVEGTAFAIRDCLEALRAAGTELDRVTAVGGGTRSRYWLAAIATALEIPVDVPAEGDFGAAFGAARLGLVAAERVDPGVVCVAPPTAETVEPTETLAEAFDEAYHRYRSLYPAIGRAFG